MRRKERMYHESFSSRLRSSHYYWVTTRKTVDHETFHHQWYTWCLDHLTFFARMGTPCSEETKSCFLWLFAMFLWIPDEVTLVKMVAWVMVMTVWHFWIRKQCDRQNLVECILILSKLLMNEYRECHGGYDEHVFLPRAVPPWEGNGPPWELWRLRAHLHLRRMMSWMFFVRAGGIPIFVRPLLEPIVWGWFFVLPSSLWFSAWTSLQKWNWYQNPYLYTFVVSQFPILFPSVICLLSIPEEDRTKHWLGWMYYVSFRMICPYLSFLMTSFPFLLYPLVSSRRYYNIICSSISRRC